MKLRTSLLAPTIISIAAVYIRSAPLLQRGKVTQSKKKKDLPSDYVMSSSTNSGQSKWYVPASFPDPDFDGKMH